MTLKLSDFRVDLEVQLAVHEVIHTETGWDHSADIAITDVYDPSGRARVRFKDGAPRFSLEVPLYDLEVPDAVDSYGAGWSVRIDFVPLNELAANPLGLLADWIRSEKGFFEYKKIGGVQQIGTESVFNNALVSANRSFSEDVNRDNSYLRLAGMKDGREYPKWKKTIVRCEPKLSFSWVEIEVEEEFEQRIEVEPVSDEQVDWLHVVEDVYDCAQRFRVRRKDGKDRLSVKVPLYERDDCDRQIKSCIRIEYKPEAGSTAAAFLEKVADHLRAEKGKVVRKQGGRLKSAPEFWINRLEDGSAYWVERDVRPDEPLISLPECLVAKKRPA